MKQMFKELFSESSGLSMMRVMTFIICLTACYLSLTKGPEELGVITTLLASAIGGKAAQKVVEMRNVDK